MGVRIEQCNLLVLFPVDDQDAPRLGDDDHVQVTSLRHGCRKRWDTVEPTPYRRRYLLEQSFLQGHARREVLLDVVLYQGTKDIPLASTATVAY